MKLLFFASSAQWAGRSELDIELARPVRLKTLLEARPELEPILRRRQSLRVAVNQEFSTFEAEVHDHDEVAFLPPVSGG